MQGREVSWDKWDEYITNDAYLSFCELSGS